MTLPRDNGVILAKILIRAQGWTPPLGDQDLETLIHLPLLLVILSWSQWPLLSRLSRDTVHDGRGSRIVRVRSQADTAVGEERSGAPKLLMELKYGTGEFWALRLETIGDMDPVEAGTDDDEVIVEGGV